MFDRFCWAAAFLLAFVACVPQRGTIGAVLGQGPSGRLYVREVPEGLAADVAGVREGDEVLLIDGRDVRRLSVEQVHAALSGEVDAPVKLTLLRAEEVVRVTLRRTQAPKPRAKRDSGK